MEAEDFFLAFSRLGPKQLVFVLDIQVASMDSAGRGSRLDSFMGATCATVSGAVLSSESRDSRHRRIP